MNDFWNDPFNPLRPLFTLWCVVMSPIVVFIVWPIRFTLGLILGEIPLLFMDDDERYEHRRDIQLGRGIWKYL
jgi:hypothetical protein